MRSLDAAMMSSAAVHSQSAAVTSEPTPDFTEVRRSAMQCLWLMRMHPVPLDAGDVTYGFHLLSCFSSAGVRLTVLATRRTGNRARSPSDNGIEWVLVPPESDRDIGGPLAARSLFSRLPNVASQYY